MKLKLSLLILLLTFKSFSQERIRSFDVYRKKHLTYKKEDEKLFTGTTESKGLSGRMIFEESFENGYLTKYILYFNIKKPTISKEILYYPGSLFKQKETEFGLIENERNHITYFDENGKKKLEEVYEYGKLTYSCEFLNNKKHGKEYCITKKCDNFSEYYENGKKIK